MFWHKVGKGAAPIGNQIPCIHLFMWEVFDPNLTNEIRNLLLRMPAAYHDYRKHTAIVGSALWWSVILVAIRPHAILLSVCEFGPSPVALDTHIACRAMV